MMKGTLPNLHEMDLRRRYYIDMFGAVFFLRVAVFCIVSEEIYRGRTKLQAVLVDGQISKPKAVS